MTSIPGAGAVEAPRLPSWAPYLATGLALTGLGAAALWAAGHIDPDTALHDAALFAHLACLVVGFGAVLTVDWVALTWVAGRCQLHDVLRQAGNVHAPIWGGFGGLVLSGVLLEPDLTTALTQAKLGLVLLIGWNGLFVMWLHAQLREHRGPVSPRRLGPRCIAVTDGLVGSHGDRLPQRPMTARGVAPPREAQLPVTMQSA